jgi:hypothetical protein
MFSLPVLPLHPWPLSLPARLPATAGRSTFSHPVVPTVHPRERGPPLLSAASHPRAIVTIAARINSARARGRINVGTASTRTSGDPFFRVASTMPR